MSKQSVINTKNIEDLRSELFKALKALNINSFEVEKARAIAELGQTIINSAKVEVDYLRVTGQEVGTGFIEKKRPSYSGLTTVTNNCVRKEAL